jgi:hypothetical protein
MEMTMRTFTAIALALSVLAGAGTVAQANPYGAQTTEQQQPSPN